MKKDKNNIDSAVIEIESDASADPDKIYKYLIKCKNLSILDNLKLNEFSLKEKKDKYAIYQAIYELNEDNLSAIDYLKNIDKENKMFSFKNIGSKDIYGEIYKKLYEETIKTKEITYKVNYDEYVKYNYIKELGGDGLELIDNQALEKTGKVIGYMAKNFGKNFFAGKNITQIALPIYINDERSSLEM